MTFLVFLLRTTVIAHLPLAVFALAISRKPWVAVPPPVVAVWLMLVAPAGTLPVVVPTPPFTVVAPRSAGLTGAGGAGVTGVAGAAGGAVGVTLAVATEATEAPARLVAVTTNV